MNYDDWKLASPDTESCELISPCCGSEFTDYINNENFGQYKCDHCGEDFDEPTEDYEYHQQMLDDIAEARADEARDMGH